MVFLVLLLVVLAHIEPGCTYQFSQPNCTLPEQDLHNFVSAPNVRGTLEIFWTCFATIIACTYTVLHLNIPEQRDGRDMDMGWKGDLKWWWKGTKSYVWGTVGTILAPEFYCADALEQLICAKQTLRHLLHLSSDASPEFGWSVVHAFYVNMGGFAIRSTKHTDFSKVPLGQQPPLCSALIALRPISVIEMLKIREPSWNLSLIPSRIEIQDRSKSDILARVIIAAQISYFCVSCLARAARHLPITLLELGTLGFAACSLVSYGLLFHKPRSANTPVVLARFEGEADPRMENILSSNGPLKRIGNLEGGSSFSPTKILGLETPVTLGLLMATVLGAIHVAGWNFAFPTSIDKWLWRMSSIASIVFAIMVVFIHNINESLGRLSLAIYSIARVALMAEMIRCLFYLPPDAFTATWTANLPHIG